jgi:hypothetical protein
MAGPTLQIDPDDHAWLVREARLRRLPLAEFAHMVFRAYREQGPVGSRTSLDDALTRTVGIWREGDGLAWQERLGDEMSR